MPSDYLIVRRCQVCGRQHEPGSRAEVEEKLSVFGGKRELMANATEVAFRVVLHHLNAVCHSANDLA
jgi:hypothetical protein